MSERGTTETPMVGKSRLETPAVGLDLVAELRSTLERAGELIRVVESNLKGASDGSEGATSAERVTELERRLATAESDVKELASRLVDSEHQGGRLMNLYVATYQLHATLDPAEVQATIAEIAINLLGAEQFVLLLRRDEGEGCEIALIEGMYDGVKTFYDGEDYTGGDPMVDVTLKDGVLRLGPTAESQALAAVPLRVQNEIVGALVLLKLLDHKPILRAEDRDLLDLLSAHAASALFAARLFATKDRKLRTLESLVKLARGE
ncbi:MAG TPA: GAF domain-containing protein [Thermoanaerobaculia bacterium]|nr:GAF domain-containing protein [Thermoanaerobaculia bacterium]